MAGKRTIRVAVAAAAAAVGMAAVGAVLAATTFGSAAPTQTTRYGHTAAVLANGKVLVAGGYSTDTDTFLASSELYDPAANAWAPTGPLGVARRGAASVALQCGTSAGKVLVAGGYGDAGVLGSVEIYNPATGAWSPSGTLGTAREDATATALGSGRVLVAGGLDGTLSATNSSEVWANGALAPTTGAMGSGRADATATRLKNGKVLVAGGSDGSFSLASAEIFDPALGTWSPAAPLTTPRENHAAALLADGRVLVAGGQRVTNVADPTLAQEILSSSEIYDPATDKWSAGPSMASAREYATATLLGDGRVLVAGGVDGASAVPAEAEIFDPATGTWSSAGAQSGSPLSAAVVLKDGHVLLTGGGSIRRGYPSTAAAELFGPGSAAPAAACVPETTTGGTTPPATTGGTTPPATGNGSPKGNDVSGRGADELHVAARLGKHRGHSVVHTTVTYRRGTKGALKAKLTRGGKVVARWSGRASAKGRSVIDLDAGHELARGKYVLTVTLANGTVVNKTITVR